MGIGHARKVQQRLNIAVLTPFAVQGVEDHVDALKRPGQGLGHIPAGIKAADLVACAEQRAFDLCCAGQ